MAVSGHQNSRSVGDAGSAHDDHGAQATQCRPPRTASRRFPLGPEESRRRLPVTADLGLPGGASPSVFTPLPATPPSTAGEPGRPPTRFIFLTRLLSGIAVPHDVPAHACAQAAPGREHAERGGASAAAVGGGTFLARRRHLPPRGVRRQNSSPRENLTLRARQRPRVTEALGSGRGGRRRKERVRGAGGRWARASASGPGREQLGGRRLPAHPAGRRGSAVRLRPAAVPRRLAGPVPPPVISAG